MARRETPDARLSVARYLVERLDPEAAEEAAAERAKREAADDAAGTAGTPTPGQRAAYIETTIQQAIRRGDFDDLPGAGRPLESLHDVHDPDWWIRRKIEREQLSGLGPPAFTLRTESAGLDDRLDALHRERDVREALEDFNRRVIEARRQLLGGPPVVTPTRDVEAGVRAWQERRVERMRAAEERRLAEEARRATLTRRERRREDRRR
ncbi:DUF1992 domain-containing protein [Galbitalea sp. SE-J8]|uniref:DnaJ family domain-containing protein n=1 Tax=Galbitalea sp. SE-J8 TaxID=3054952 RepID=UPI00259D1E1F|nr:DUF1992 domain-containing protein [Galbitalea sp. SE-J8]MDM4761725.1 DUF1992 domain-containing protein [Galbitalea sp. SE-J8]